MLGSLGSEVKEITGWCAMQPRSRDGGGNRKLATRFAGGVTLTRLAEALPLDSSRRTRQWRRGVVLKGKIVGRRRCCGTPV
jgi:hypothetical protein